MLQRLFLLSALGISLGACNLFGFISPPTNDAQRLSLARACFDEGDFVCASKQYGDVTDQTAVAASELILSQLDDLGVGLPVIISAFADRGTEGAGFINALANKLVLSPYGDTGANAETRRGAESLRRTRIFSALKAAQDLTDANLRAFDKFLASAALVAAILSEQADSGTFAAASLTSDPTACAALTEVLCADTNSNESCATPTGKQFAAGDVLDPALFTYDFDGEPTLQMLNYAMYHLVDSTAGLGAGGVSGSTNTTATALRDAGTNIGNAPACYRRILLTQGIGS